MLGQSLIHIYSQDGSTSNLLMTLLVTFAKLATQRVSTAHVLCHNCISAPWLLRVSWWLVWPSKCTKLGKHDIFQNHSKVNDLRVSRSQVPPGRHGDFCSIWHDMWWLVMTVRACYVTFHLFETGSKKKLRHPRHRLFCSSAKWYNDCLCPRLQASNKTPGQTWCANLFRQFRS